MSEIITVDTSALQQKQDEVAVVLARADGITIATQEQFEDANGVLIVVKGKIKELDDLRKSITRPIDDGKKRIMDLFRNPLDRLDKARDALTRAIKAYSEEQERRRQELQAKLQREADEKARKERERLEARAAKAAEKGNEAKAEALLEQAEEVAAAPVPVVLTMTQPKGLAYRDNWKAEIVDVDQVPREYMIPDQKALDKVMQATKGTLKIPGVKAINDKVLMSRATA